jgi:hypothetical protein
MLRVYGKEYIGVGATRRVALRMAIAAPIQEGDPPVFCVKT